MNVINLSCSLYCVLWLLKKLNNPTIQHTVDYRINYPMIHLYDTIYTFGEKEKGPVVVLTMPRLVIKQKCRFRSLMRLKQQGKNLRGHEEETWRGTSLTEEPVFFGVSSFVICRETKHAEGLECRFSESLVSQDKG